MNWVRGLFRLWIVSALLWIVLAGALAEIVPSAATILTWGPAKQQALDTAQAEGKACADDRKANPEHGSLFGCFEREAAATPMTPDAAWKNVDQFLVIALSVPAAALAAGWGLLWLARGFRWG